MKRKCLLAALAVACMVASTNTPMEAVAAEEANTISAQQAVEIGATLEEVNEMIPDTIKLGISSYEAVNADGGFSTGCTVLAEELSKIIAGTGYKITTYTPSLTLSEVYGISMYDPQCYRYTIADQNDSTSSIAGTIEVEYTHTHSYSDNEVLAKSDAAVKAVLQSFDAIEDLNVYVSYDEFYKKKLNEQSGVEEYFGLYTDEFGVRVEYTPQKGDLGMTLGLMYYILEDECIAVHSVGVKTEGSVYVINKDGSYYWSVGDIEVSSKKMTDTAKYEKMSNKLSQAGYGNISGAYDLTLESGDISGGLPLVFMVGANDGEKAMILQEKSDGTYIEHKIDSAASYCVSTTVTELSSFMVAFYDGDVEELNLNPTTGLTAKSSGKNRVSLSWNPVDNADGYLVYGLKNGKYGYVGMTTQGTTFNDINAIASDYNYYWVFPYYKDTNGNMITGSCPSYSYAKGVCAAVTYLRGYSQTGSVKLTWVASYGAEEYLVYGKTATGAYGYIGMTTGTTFTHTTASKTEYNFYWVYPTFKDTSGNRIVGLQPSYVYGIAK